MKYCDQRRGRRAESTTGSGGPKPPLPWFRQYWFSDFLESGLSRANKSPPSTTSCYFFKQNVDTYWDAHGDLQGRIAGDSRRKYANMKAEISLDRRCVSRLLQNFNIPNVARPSDDIICALKHGWSKWIVVWMWASKFLVDATKKSSQFVHAVVFVALV